MLKHVAPVDPKASIPDPDHYGFLPAEGRTVAWNAYWAGLAAREEIAVTDARDEAADEPAPAAEAHTEA